MARQRADEIGRRVLALHARRPDDDPRGRVADGQDAEDVAQRRAVERRDDADASRQHGQRALATRVEEAFGAEPLLQLLEGQLERAEAVRLERVADDLVLALGGIHADAAARDDVLAVFGRELEQTRASCGTSRRAAARASSFSVK